MTGRAGHYVMQPQGYRAFIPAPLPPDPPVDVSGSLQSLLSEADYALGRLDGAILTLPNPDLFVYMYVRKEAVLSSQIEGTQSSLQNLLAAEAQLLDPDAPADVAEVVNYVRDDTSLFRWQRAARTTADYLPAYGAQAAGTSSALPIALL
jgi:hypothetical protein